MSTSIATWIIAISTAVYVAVVWWTACYIRGQLRENKMIREVAVLKDVYDYVIRTHNDRKVIYRNRKAIEAVKTFKDLDNFEKKRPRVYHAIHEVANCYHYTGFLMKHGLLTNKSAIFEEGGDTILNSINIIGTIIKLERERIPKETYKQYLEYLKFEIEEWKRP